MMQRAFHLVAGLGKVGRQVRFLLQGRTEYLVTLFDSRFGQRQYIVFDSLQKSIHQDCVSPWYAHVVSCIQFQFRITLSVWGHAW